MSVEPDETLRISVGEHAYSLPRASCKSASFTEVSKNYSWLKEKDFFILQQRFIYEMNFFALIVCTLQDWKTCVQLHVNNNCYFITGTYDS